MRSAPLAERLVVRGSHRFAAWRLSYTPNMPSNSAITNKPLALDLLEWIARRPRPYAEVMDAWRTSCPRLPIWEDAVDAGFVVQTFEAGAGVMVTVTDAGRDFLRAEGRDIDIDDSDAAASPAGSSPLPGRDVTR